MALRLRQLCPLLRRCSHDPSQHSQCLSSQSASGDIQGSSGVIRVTPAVSLFDQKVQVKVTGLPVKEKVTLHVSTQQDWRRKPVEFTSCSHYVTSEQGDLDLSRDGSIGGTFTGVDPMGPFWSLRPSPAGPQNIRMVVRNGDEPVEYRLSVYQGHRSLGELVACEPGSEPLCSTQVTRLKAAADVTRIPVRDGNVRGMLFMPPGEGPHPGVIDLFGSAGGLMELRAMLLASHGFAVLALPFFRYQDLPKDLKEVTFDYFEEAVSWLSLHKKVKDSGIGIVGVSTGAEFALLSALNCPQVQAVVHINGPPTYLLYDLFRKDGTLVAKGLEIDPSQADYTEEGLGLRNVYAFDTWKEICIPVWKSDAHVLILQSDDDQQLDPTLVDQFVSLYPSDRRHLVEVRHYPGAGHLLEPPYSPHCRTCHNPTFGIDFLWGGTPADHTVAQAQSWNDILNFLNNHLR